MRKGTSLREGFWEEEGEKQSEREQEKMMMKIKTERRMNLKIS